MGSLLQIKQKSKDFKMLYDIYNIKKSIIEYEKNLRKLSIRKRKTDISNIEISNLSFLYASLEYLKSVNIKW